MSSWQLFIDESGAADNPADRLLVGGLLVPGRATSSFRNALEETLRRATQGAPWPPHANRLRIAANRVEGAARGGAASPAAQAALALVRAAAHPVPERWLAEVGQTQETNRATLQALNQWLRGRAWSLWSALRQEAMDVDQAVNQTIGRIHGAVAVGALDPGDGAAGPGYDRWSRTFRALVAHLGHLIGTGDRVITVARYPNIGTVGPLAAAAVAGTHVRPTALPPVRWDHQTVGGIVAADFVTNRLRPALRGTWAQVTARAPTACGLPVVWAPTSGPTVIPTRTPPTPTWMVP